MITPRVKAYLTDVTPLFDDAAFGRLYEKVSDRRREKTDRFRYKKDRCLSLGAEFLFMTACQDFGIDYKNASVSLSERSKPFFTDIPVFFNLSHSGTRAMCVMSDMPVGCDVEKIKDADIRIADRFFSPAERSLLENRSSPADISEMFYRLWTLKESYIKCIGMGLSLPLGSFSVTFGDEGIGIEQDGTSGCFRLFEHCPDNGYRYAWCIKNDTKGDAALDTGIYWKDI